MTHIHINQLASHLPAGQLPMTQLHINQLAPYDTYTYQSVSQSHDLAQLSLLPLQGR